ncbi:putative alkyl/aryl-sulfatase, partial [Alcanivorax marinus]|nr:putative alkyl/aryl-sulfatase [Alloalcanivorax marinus]
MQEHAKPAQPATVAHNRGCCDSLPFHDRRDYDNAARGFIDGFHADVIRRDRDGRAVWDFRAYDFQDTEVAPDTVHPSLWRGGP